MKRTDGVSMRGMLVIAFLLAACGRVDQIDLVIEVPGDFATLAAAIAEAPDGAAIHVAPGRYPEQIIIERPISIIADQGRVELGGPAEGSVIYIAETHHVTIRGLTVMGGDIGISIFASSDVIIAENSILGSRYRGVQVLNGSAYIIDNEIRPAFEPYVIGIRVANASSWPRSLISGNIVDHVGAYGIAINFAGADIEDNIIRGGQRAGIAINEMSIADVTNNAVSNAPRYGILITDMSHAVVTSNQVVGALEPIKLQYHAEAELKDNQHR